MANWIKTPTNTYYQASQIIAVTAMQDPNNSANFIIQAEVASGVATLRQGFVSQAAAQTALDNAIINLGGSV